MRQQASPSGRPELGRTSAAGLIRRIRELGLEVPTNIDKAELRAFVEEAERLHYSSRAVASSRQALSPCRQTKSVAELKGRLRELGVEIPSTIVEKGELVALVEEVERLQARGTDPREAVPAGPARLKLDIPSPWSRQESRSRPGRFYYVNANTGESTWEPWFRQESRSSPGQFYYANVETGHTTWEPPTKRFKDLIAEAASGRNADTEMQALPPPDSKENLELELDPQEPFKLDYRDDAFGNSDGISVVPAAEKRPAIASILSCTHGNHGVASFAVVAPNDAWEHLPVHAEIVMGLRFNWRRGPLIGRGSLGRVFKASNQTNGMIMAVKEVPICQGDRNDAQYKEALDNEVDIMQNLEHPHIVAYYGHDYLDNCLYMYLEYLPGGTLTQALYQFGRLDECLIVLYSKQLLLGLDYLHSQATPVIHRDIKGSNILIGMNGEVKLADFGCSKRTADTLTHTMRGSIPWMAPEVMCHGRYGLAADVWSFGCVMIEMGTASVPWGNFEHWMAALVRIGLSEETPPLPEDLSVACEDFISQCVKRDPSQRPSVSDLVHHDLLTSQ